MDAEQRVSHGLLLHGWRSLLLFVLLACAWAVALVLGGAGLGLELGGEDLGVFDVLFSGLASLGFVGIAVLLAGLKGRPRSLVLGLRRPVLGGLAMAFVAGMALSLFASGLAEFLSQWNPWFSDLHLSALAALLVEGSPGSRVLTLVLVLVLAPLAEELLFRGFLWDGLQELGGRTLALILSSLLFAAYHGDPLHVISVLPLSFALGFLRAATASLWSAMAAHFGNNLLAVGLVLSGIEELSIGVAIAGGLASLLLVVASASFPSPLENARE
tara:strand:+ start:7802 stop:8617 length:816 start_codon:yes stop_codon:yes gene_type:complete